MATFDELNGDLGRIKSKLVPMANTAFDANDTDVSKVLDGAIEHITHARRLLRTLMDDCL